MYTLLSCSISSKGVICWPSIFQLLLHHVPSFNSFYAYQYPIYLRCIEVKNKNKNYTEHWFSGGEYDSKYNVWLQFVTNLMKLIQDLFISCRSYFDCNFSVETYFNLARIYFYYIWMTVNEWMLLNTLIDAIAIDLVFLFMRCAFVKRQNI